MGPEGTLAARLRGLQDYDPEGLRVEVAREAIRRLIRPIVDTERVDLADASARVLAEDIAAPFDVPGSDNAAMDGYALRSADLQPDTQTTLRQVGVVLAGHRMERSLGPGECVRIMTGAALPPGADTVVMQELSRASQDSIHIPAGQRRGQHVRRAGEDLEAGGVMLAAGQLLQPADLGLIASVGIGSIRVMRRLRVAFFSTGDEVVSIGEPLAPGQLYDANRYTLKALLERLGVQAIDMGVVRDDPAALERALREAAQSADAIVTSGGVSGGDADYVRAIVGRLGEVLFWKLAMRPGRPMAFGRIGDAWLFGLPGNPVATMITFIQFVREAVLRLGGCARPPALATFAARSAGTLRKTPGRVEYQRGILMREAGGEWSVNSTGDQGSGILRSMSQANCLIVLEYERGNVQPGERVQVQPLE